MQQNLRGHKKNLGGHCPECTPRGYGPGFIALVLLAFCLWIVLWFSCCWRCSFVLQEQCVIYHGPLLGNNEIRTLYFCRSDPKSSDHHLHAKNAASYCRYCYTRKGYDNQAEFHFSWSYTFPATPSSLRIWAPDPSKVTGCGPVLSCAAVLIIWQLFLTCMQHHELKLDSNKAIQLLRGIDLITFRFLQCPGVLALICFSCWNTNYRQIKSTQLLPAPMTVTSEVTLGRDPTTTMRAHGAVWHRVHIILFNMYYNDFFGWGWPWSTAFFVCVE